MNRFTPLLFAVGLLIVATPTQADIYQWEYINPFDHNEGKRQSTTLAPDGAGVDAVPGVDLSNRDLTKGYLILADLTDADGRHANLTNADLSRASLTNANFSGATLTNADGPGIYLLNADLSQANLTNVDFSNASLAYADFRQANLTNARFSFSRLGHADLRQANLSNAGFLGAILTDVDFAGAEIRGANFARLCISSCSGTGITLDQLYSTASYQEGDLRGVFGVGLENAITTNLILPDGHIDGLNLNGIELLVVRDYDGNPSQYPYFTGSIPITVDQHLTMGPIGTLRMVFEADAWDSTISFAPGIPVTLGGTLELTFADDVNLASHLGRTFDLFDWTGVTPTGTFAVSSPYRWNLANLYTTGEVTLTAIPEPSSLILLSVFSFITNTSRRFATRRVARKIVS